MNRAADHLLPAGSVGLALLLMVPVFGAGPLVLDEHAAYWLSAPHETLSIWERSVRYAAVPPLASWLQAGSMTVLGETEFALRLPSVLAYGVAAGLMALAFRPAIGATPAAMAAFALAIHPDVVDEVRVGRTYGLVVLLMTLLLLITLRWRAKNLRLYDGLFWGLTATAGVWTHILTIPVAGMSAILIGGWDVVVWRTLRPATIVGWLLAVLLCVPLIPMGERIWEWRHALNYQTGNVALAEAVGPFVWLGLPIGCAGLMLALFTRGLRPKTSDSSSDTRVTRSRFSIIVCLAMGLVPLGLLVAAGQGDLSSLTNPRYRVPLAPANACLLGLLVSQQRGRWWALAVLTVSLVATWTAVGRSPMQLVRLNTAQAPVWKQMAETLEAIVSKRELETAPVFVQSGLIEGVLIPLFPEDVEFHGYVSSRLGRFYAKTANPRYALPLFWSREHPEMFQFFDRILSETAASKSSDLFVAVATDTDVNRRSFEDFEQLLRQYSYQRTRIAGREPWAILYHYRRKPPDG